jgi:putative membrane protein
MKGLLTRWIVSAVALYFTAVLGHALGFDIVVENAVSALLAVAVLAVVNALIRPLIVMLTLPLNCLTLGLLTFVINGLMFWLVGVIGIPGFKVKGFFAALFGSVVMGLLSGLVNSILVDRRED